MSRYDKPQEPFIYGYAATRSDQQQNYDALVHAPVGLQYAGSEAQVPHGTLSTGQMPLIPDQQQYEPARDVAGYQPSHYPLIDQRTQRMPEVIQYELSPYSQGTKICIRIQSQYDLLSPPSLLFTMQVGYSRVAASLSALQGQDHFHQYSVIADAPPFQSSASSNSNVPLLLEMWDTAGRCLNNTEVGNISYPKVEDYGRYSSSPSSFRKRKASSQAGEYNRSPAKRLSTQQLRTRAREESLPYESATSSISPSSPFVTPGPPTSSVYNRSLGRQPQQQQQPQLQVQPSPQFPYHYTSTEASQGGAEVQSPLITTSQASSYVPSSMSTVRAGATPATPASSGKPEPSSSSTNPPLIRTSTIQPSPTSSMQGSLSTQGFNPYAIFPSKAVLKIEGDLDKMSDNWTDEEWEANRRLVQFTRKQSGSVIHTSFQPVTLEERAANSICVSCIWWEEKQECFVTSVDTIYLLESLVGVRFTVEEKNRIRRNLEGFRPATVSKAKQDSEEFFKIIMGFPNPKPRNIEKDVKVFPWRILAHALKKIIGKYSASYSSTAGALPRTSSRGYGSSSGSSGLATEALSLSPRSRSTSHGYASSITSTSMLPTSGPSAGPTDVQLHSAVPADFRVGIGATVPAHLDPAPTQDAGAYPIPLAQQMVQQPQHPEPRQASVTFSNLLGAGGRASWDLSSYMTPSPVTATPGGAAQALQQQYDGSMTGSDEYAAAQGLAGQRMSYHGMPGYQQTRGA